MDTVTGECGGEIHETSLLPNEGEVSSWDNEEQCPLREVTAEQRRSVTKEAEVRRVEITDCWVADLGEETVGGSVE